MSRIIINGIGANREIGVIRGSDKRGYGWFDYTRLAAAACVVHRARASEGGILDIESTSDEHPML